VSVRGDDRQPRLGPTADAPTAAFQPTAERLAQLVATASDSDGRVVKVEFFNGATKLSEETTAPYTSQLNTRAAGTFAITARATDNAGAVTTSTPVTVTTKKKR